MMHPWMIPRKERWVLTTLAAMLLSASTLACTGVSHPLPPAPTPAPPTSVPPDLSRAFAETLRQMVAFDRQSAWTDQACEQVSSSFRRIAQDPRFVAAAHPEAAYNAGLVLQRCGRHADAKAQFEASLRVQPDFQRAKVQLALHAYRERGDAGLDSTIAALREAVVAAKFQDADALVNLAMLQMRRDGEQDGVGCDNDRACSKLNVQRALALDDGYMPAFNQLALYYLQEAKRKVAAEQGPRRRMAVAQDERRALSGQMLDLAALVCTQAIRKNTRYAPIHNTLGLIEVEQRNITGAVQSFQRARSLDPRFFEAHMNYAAVNLSFRGFPQAEEAYRQALAMRPDSYEAKLGLALALRGRLTAENIDRALPAVEEALAEAKRVDPARPEAYFNEAILIQEFKAKYAEGDKEKLAQYDRALAGFDTFLKKAAGPEFVEAIDAAKQRKEDIAKIRDFILSGMQQPPGAPVPPAS